MDEAAVLLALLEAHLTDGLEEGLALDVAGVPPISVMTTSASVEEARL